MSQKRKSGATVPRSNNSKYQPSAPSSTTTYILGGIAILVIAGLVIGGIWWNGRDKGEADQAALAASSTMVVGPESAPLIDVFEDPMCPACREFEQQAGPAIASAVDEGKLRVRYHTLNFLNQKSGSGDYSSRAAGALACVAGEQNADLFLRFHSALFAAQPEAGGDISSPDLARMASEQGATPATATCITDNAKVAQANENAAKSSDELEKATGGPAGTPSVLFEGELVENLFDGTAWLDDILGGNNA